MEFLKKKASEMIPDSLKEEIQGLAVSAVNIAITKILESPEVREIKRKFVRELAERTLQEELDRRLGESYPFLQKSARTILLPLMSHALDKAIDQAIDQFKNRMTQK